MVDKNGKMYNITDKPKSISSSYEQSDDEKEKVKSLLYILDSFGISDEATIAIAIVDAKENLFQLKNSLQKFFRNLMHYLKQKMMKAICPTLQTLQIKLQTMKFLLTVLGMNAANSKFSCIYCKIEKNDHFDMKKDKDFFGQGK